MRHFIILVATLVAFSFTTMPASADIETNGDCLGLSTDNRDIVEIDPGASTFVFTGVPYVNASGVFADVGTGLMNGDSNSVDQGPAFQFFDETFGHITDNDDVGQRIITYCFEVLDPGEDYLITSAMAGSTTDGRDAFFRHRVQLYDVTADVSIFLSVEEVTAPTATFDGTTGSVTGSNSGTLVDGHVYKYTVNTGVWNFVPGNPPLLISPIAARSDIDTDTTMLVPEPGTASMFAGGGLVLAMLARRKVKKI